MSFESLGLEVELLRALDAQGYTKPTPIQQRAIQPILQGDDVLAGAQTGTGKTAAFALPILQRLSARQNKKLAKHRAPRALVLAPTRELAAQVRANFVTYGANLELQTIEIFGGVGFEPQKRALQRGADVVVATPGRLLDHIGQGTIDLSSIVTLVLDEADRMLDMGFIRDIKKVIAALPARRQNLLFSATYSKEIESLANSILYRPKLIEVNRRNTSARTVEQSAYEVDKTRKCDLLCHLITTHSWHQVLVFTRTKHGGNRLAQQLHKAGIDSTAIHGNKSQSARTRALADFKNGKAQVLVATDIAARGLDIEDLPYVVNYDLPNVAEDYVHRIGRTGRAGKSGIAVSLVDKDERGLLKAIARLLKREISRESLPDFDRRRDGRPVVAGREGKVHRGSNAPGGASHRASRGKANTNSRKRRSRNTKASDTAGRNRHAV